MYELCQIRIHLLYIQIKSIEKATFSLFYLNLLKGIKLKGKLFGIFSYLNPFFQKYEFFPDLIRPFKVNVLLTLCLPPPQCYSYIQCQDIKMYLKGYILQRLPKMPRIKQNGGRCYILLEKKM